MGRTTAGYTFKNNRDPGPRIVCSGAGAPRADLMQLSGKGQKVVKTADRLIQVLDLKMGGARMPEWSGLAELESGF